MTERKKNLVTNASRRSFLKTAAGTLGGAAISSYPIAQAHASGSILQAPSPSADRRPNIVLLHSHDLGRFLHCYGVQTVHTPNLDKLAAEGVLFERCYATAPQCSPSRASIFTGRYPHSNGVMGLAHSLFAWDLNPDELHLGQILKGAGYRTAGVGVLAETHSGPQRCGLDEYMKSSWATDVADATIALLQRFSQENEPFYIQAGTLEPHRIPGKDRNRDIGFLGENLTADTSHGVTVPKYLQDTPGTRTEVGELQGAVRHVDEQFGRVLNAVRELGIEKNTLVIFTTDHGVALPRAKCAVYEPGQETAFILRFPGRQGWYGGRREQAMISNIDYLPTLLELARIPIPSTVQGRSFAPLLDGGTYRERDAIFYELTYHDYYDPRRAVRTETHKLIVNLSNAHAFMDPSQSWRPRSDTLVPPNNALAYHPSIEFYNLKDDPWEQHDLAAEASAAEAVDKLRMMLLSHMQLTRDPILDGAVTSPMHRRSTDWLRSGPVAE